MQQITRRVRHPLWQYHNCTINLLVFYFLNFFIVVKKNKEMEQEFLMKEGDIAPDFTFKDSNNKDLKLSNFLGKQVVLYFYPRDFTPGCTTEASEFAKDYNNYYQK